MSSVLMSGHICLDDRLCESSVLSFTAFSVAKSVRSKIRRESRFVFPTPSGSKSKLDLGGVDCASCVCGDCGGGESGDSALWC